MSRKATALIPKREVLRRCDLAPGTLAALVKAGAFPASIEADRWHPDDVERWMQEAQGRDQSRGGRGE